MKNGSCSIVAIASLFFTPMLASQATYTATRSTRIQVGAAAMYLDTGDSDEANKGLLLYADYDFTRWIGLEVEARFGGIDAPSFLGENSYLAGPRISYRRNRATAYGKLMIGRGTITNQITTGSSSYNLYAYGGGLEYRVRNRFNLRAIDAEFQKWPGFFPNSLNPIAISIGIAYIIH